MRRFVIDTDTGSDDAVALLMALREPSIHVEAITTVAGNCRLHYATANALASIEVAGTYRPKVYEGCGRPLIREAYHAEFVHGVNGMGDMELPQTSQTKEEMHAVDALIHYSKESDGELELISLGPATNLGLAIRKDPAAMKRYKHLYMMMGTGNGPGNVTPTAEFNAFADPEALKIVLDFEIPVTLIGWDASMNERFLDQKYLKEIRGLNNPVSDFALDCNATLIQFNKERLDVEIKSELTYGTIATDFMNTTAKDPNVEIVFRLDGNGFRNKLKKLLTD